MLRDKAWGIAALVGGVTLFSTIEIAGKVIGARVDPIVLTFIRFFLTGLILIPLSRAWSLWRFSELDHRDFGRFAFNGFVGVTLAIPLFHVAILTFEKAASSAVVFSVNPVFITILARFINGEAWTPRRWGAVILGGVGVSLFAMESGHLTADSLRGLGLMLVAAFLFGLSICLTRRFVARYGALTLMGFSALIGSLILLPVAAWRLSTGGADGLVESWPGVLYISVAGTAVAYCLYYGGIARTSAHHGAMAFFLKPVIASVLAVLVLGEDINVFMLGGTALIVAGLVLSVRLPSRRAVSS